MGRRLIAALIGMFLVGAVVGVVVARLVDDSGDADRAPTEEECTEANDVIDRANAEIESLTSSDDAQDRGYFAAVMAQFRAIDFTMAARPGCFTLSERAQAAGLVSGIELLGATTPTDTVPIVPVPDEGSSEGDQPVGSDAPTTTDG